MKLLDHPNMVKLYDCIELPPYQKCTVLVLEFIEGGELFDYIVAHRKLKEQEAAKYLRQIISGLSYLHSNMIVHRGDSSNMNC